MGHKMQVFVSHAYEDRAFCEVIVEGLRGAGAEVWYDENAGTSARRTDMIQRELRRLRPIVVVALSPTALQSPWVRDEVEWACAQYERMPTRIILPVLAAPLPDENQIWPCLRGFERIGITGLRPYAPDEVLQRLLQALALTPLVEESVAIAAQPGDSVDILLARARALMAQERWAEALPLVERASHLDERSFAAWVCLGAVLHEVRRYEEAIAAYKRAIALDHGRSAAVWDNLANTLACLNRHDESLVAIDQALALDPNDAFAWNNRGAALNILGRYEEALTALDQALALDPDDAYAWTNRGNALCDLHRYDEALVAYDHALALDSTYAFAWGSKGILLVELGRYEEALAAYDHALTLDSDDAPSWNNKGQVLNTLERYGEALAALDHALTLDSTCAIAWSIKGVVLINLERYEEALAALDHALAIDGANAATWFNKGLALGHLERYDDALAVFDQSLALDPDDATTWNNKGLTLEYLERYEEALAIYDRGFDRGDPEAWEAHARIYHALGRTAEAEAAERRADELGGFDEPDDERDEC